ncbi:hypothetical protein TWF481_007933 [Arthrobotrys musiformis]|uniref:Uncharacterized protein n=1 Tax=Arthrobotrys musiformis TaxID=47236 RepID=A0AAV9W5M9_9PEZI
MCIPSYGLNDPGTSSSQAPGAPIGYNYGYTTGADPTTQSCPAGYDCPSTETTAFPYQSLVIVPTCSSWKTCPECRGGYKCWKPRPTSTEAPAETTSDSLTITPTCYPWKYCYNCIGGYSCLSDPAPTTPTTAVPNPNIYPISDPTDETYTLVITRGTDYTTVTETIPASYDGYGYSYGTYGGASQPSETTSIYDWAAYEQPTCTDYIVCPTCALGYYCPNNLVPSAPAYYQPSSQDPTSASSTSPLQSFYPLPPCNNYVVCQDCFLGYYCPGPSQSTPTTSEYPVKSYGSPPCDDYIVCPTCPIGYYCPSSLSSDTLPDPTAAPGYGTPSCSDYIVCPSCSLGYYCPKTTTPPQKYSTSSYNWASYEQPSCPDYVLCPSCPLGYYCPAPTTAAEQPPKTYAYGVPTCSNYIVCPSCALGYYCPQLATSTDPAYSAKPSGNKYSSKPWYPSAPSTTYYIGLPTTTLVVAPTCSEYVLCPVCPGSYYCPSKSPRPTVGKSVPYYYTDPNTSETPTVTIPPCDVYVFCPECNLGYSCLVRSTSSSTKGPKPYKTGGTANPPLSNPYPASTSRSRMPTVDGAYVTAPGKPRYGSASVSAPGLPTCAGYVLCPTCPLGYYCTSTVSPTVAPSKYYGVAPTGIVEPIYSTTIVLPPYTPLPSCPDPIKTVTITKTRDIYRLYNICAPDPYAILTSFIIPTATITRCDPENTYLYTQPTPQSSTE